MTCPITLCTGQWADLPLKISAPMAKSFGFDGLELACFGDHFEVDPVRFIRRFPDRIFHEHMKDAIVTLDGESGILS